MLTLWSFCLLGQIFIIKLDGIFVEPVAGFTLVAILTVVILCLQPFHCFYRTARLEILRVMFEIAASPFTQVRFKHFIIADVFTSFVNPMKDLGAVVCYFSSGLWL